MDGFTPREGIDRFIRPCRAPTAANGSIVLRFVQFIVLAVVLLAGAVGFTLVLSHGAPGMPDAARVEGLGAGATVAWFDDGRPLRIDAASTDDAMRALGFALAEEDAWSMLAWRQAARGRLAEWLGASVLPVDRHVRQIGIARGADRAAADLDSLTRRRLDAFCAGVNAAFATARVRRGPQVTLLGVVIEPWTVADVLASERLAAWIATDAPAAPFPAVAFGATASADAGLRRLLAADGLGASRAWTFTGDARRDTLVLSSPAADSAATARADSAGAPTARLVATYVTGSQARPMLRTAEVRIAGAAPRLLVLLPGTPFPVAGAFLDADGSARRAWAVLPRGEASWQTVPAEVEASVRAERMSVLGGQESVLYAPEVGGTTTIRAQPPKVRRIVRRDTLAAAVTSTPSTVPVPPDSAAAPIVAAALPDTVVTQAPPSRWRLAWLGDGSAGAFSDAAAWLGLWEGEATALRIVRGGGLVVARGDGGAIAATALGPAAAHRRGLAAAAPARADTTAAGSSAALTSSAADSLRAAPRTAAARLVAGLPLARVLAARLDAIARLPPWPSDDAVRPSARDAAHAIAARIDPATLGRPIERAALETLVSWDGSYDANSVGATLFETVSAAETARNGVDAFAAARDSAYFAATRRHAAFVDAVQTLRQRYGARTADWRRGAVLPQQRRFAFWGTPGLDGLSARSRYAPFDVPGGGHPLALAYGPDTPDGAATTVEIDFALTPGMPVRLRTVPLDVDAFLGRYRASLAPLAVPLAPATPTRQTVLSPR